MTLRTLASSSLACCLGVMVSSATAQVSYEKVFPVPGITASAAVLASDGYVYVANGPNLIKEDPDGTTLWMKQLQSNGNLVTMWKIAEGAPGELVAVLQHDGGFGIAKLDTSGSVLSAWNYTLAPNFTVRAVEVDTVGNVYVLNALRFDVIKLTTTGSVEWAHRFEPPDNCGAIELRPDGDLYITASSNRMYASTSRVQLAVHRMDTSGTLLSTIALSDTLYDTPSLRCQSVRERSCSVLTGNGCMSHRLIRAIFRWACPLRAWTP